MHPHHQLQHLHEALAQAFAVHTCVQLQLVAVDHRVIAGQLEPLHLILNQLILLHLKPAAAGATTQSSRVQHNKQLSSTGSCQAALGLRRALGAAATGVARVLASLVQLFDPVRCTDCAAEQSPELLPVPEH